jgi:opacity protein-like surface antigen
MRRLLLAAVVVVGAHGARAADMPDYGPLRGALPDGPARVVNWQGFYVGGQAGYGASDMNFTNATKSTVAKLLAYTTIESEMAVSSWPVLGKKSSQGSGYGGFVGYNSQWDDVVVGLEANYMHGTFGGTDSGSMGRQFYTSNGVLNDITYTAKATMNVTDIGSARLRAGYAWNSLLPYAFGAVSMGQGDIYRRATISGTQNGVPFNPLSQIDSQNSHFLYGYGGGLGVDMMLFSGLFLRAEWEYLKFAAPIDTSVSTVRAGLGYKF